MPVARVRRIPEAMADGHFRARGTLRPMFRQGSDEPVAGGVVSGFPVSFSGGALPELEGGAQLGHHNREVFGRLLGLDAGRPRRAREARGDLAPGPAGLRPPAQMSSEVSRSQSLRWRE